MEEIDDGRSIRILPPKLVLHKIQPSLQWLIGSPFSSPLTTVSTLRCVHHSSPAENISSDYHKESEGLRTLLLKGFYVIGALIVGNSNNEENARKAIDAVRRLRKLLSNGDKTEDGLMIGAVMDFNSTDILFFVSESENSLRLDYVTSVVYENNPERYIWESGCLLRCELPINLPLYIPLNNPSEWNRRIKRGFMPRRILPAGIVMSLEKIYVLLLAPPNACTVRGV